MILRNEIELLAPVGSYESLRGAIQAGADAIYFGVDNLNMRSMSAKSFKVEDIQTITKICHENNIKCYLTLNTVMYDRDLVEVEKIIKHAHESHVDAIVASDVSVLLLAQKYKIPLHLSTQVNISNIEALAFYAQFADVVVLARELNLQQVNNIYNNILIRNIKGPAGNHVKIEMFIHGALCMAISGKCYLSLHLYNHSANRGECFQLCRRSYLVTDKETNNQLEIDNEYIMSPKDLCTIEFLDKIIEAGVKVLKIEGRARSPEYVYTVTKAYNKALEAIIHNSYNQQLKENLLFELKKVYNRGFWNGYYLGEKLGEWSNKYGSVATKRKVYVGKITNFFKKIGVAEIILESDHIAVSDTVLIMGNSTGVVEETLTEIRFNNLSVQNANKGQIVSVKLNNLVHRNDKVFKWIDV